MKLHHFALKIWNFPGGICPRTYLRGIGLCPRRSSFQFPDTRTQVNSRLEISLKTSAINHSVLITVSFCLFFFFSGSSLDGNNMDARAVLVWCVVAMEQATCSFNNPTPGKYKRNKMIEMSRSDLNRQSHSAYSVWFDQGGVLGYHQFKNPIILLIKN